MPITKVGSTITETPVTDMDQFLRTGVIRSDSFAICSKDKIKQLQFNVDSLTTNTTITFAAPSGTGGTVTLPTSGALATQVLEYVVPTVGQTKTVSAGTTVYVMEPAGTLATLTVVLPTAPADGTTVSLSFANQTVTALTLSGGGSDTVVGAQTDSAGGFGAYTYRASTSKWYRVG